MNIFKTFETYLKEPLSIFADNLFQLVNIQTGNIFTNKPSVDVDFVKGKRQITVVNNEKLYNFLSLVKHRTDKKNLDKEVKKD